MDEDNTKAFQNTNNMFLLLRPFTQVQIICSCKGLGAKIFA